MHNHDAKLWMLFLVAAICLGINACGHHSGDLLQGQTDLFWPNEPDIKRIRFCKAISGPGDLNIQAGWFKKVFRYIGGTQQVSMVSPYGVTLDASGRIYIVDTFLRQVHVFDRKNDRYHLFPSNETKLIFPVDIAIDDNSGSIFVTDSKQGVVKIFKDSGRRFDSEFGRGVFKRPTGIAVNPQKGELLVVDTVKSRIFRFDLSSHQLKGSFGGSGQSDGRFHYPTHISLTPDGNIIVSDSLNFRIQLFSPEGRFLTKFGRMGNAPGTFSRPKGVASDSDGNIYVVDALFDNVQIFDKDGRLLMAFGTHGREIGSFWLPSGIYIDQNDFIYVSDTSNQRLQVFHYLKEDISK